MSDTQNTQERQILTIEEDKYYIDSVTDEGKNLIASINATVSEQERLKIQTGIAQIAFDTLLLKLKEEAKSFERVQ